MNKPMKNMMIATAVLAVAGSATASIWSGAALDDDWDNAGNWDVAPTAWSGEVVTLDTVGAIVNKAAGNDAPGLGDINVVNGALNVSGHIGGGMMRVGQGAGNSGAVTVVSGDGSFGGWKSLQLWGASIGEAGTGSFVNNGGTALMGVSGAWFVLGGTGTMNLNGGYTTIDVDATGATFILDGVIDLAGGALAIKGDVLSEAGGWILAQKLTSYGQTADASDFTEKFAFDFDTTNTGYTTITAVPEPATLGMVALMGGGILWIRKRLLI
ncbi:MAG: hypothetical protein DRP64_01910 [Verrucomicrobia bacterium]|nr:MAG: hypothetical protein DRP64_01910 [Verrucomicrobiota bacterium]